MLQQKPENCEFGITTPTDLSVRPTHGSRVGYMLLVLVEKGKDSHWQAYDVPYFGNAVGGPDADTQYFLPDDALPEGEMFAIAAPRPVNPNREEAVTLPDLGPVMMRGVLVSLES